MSMSRPFFVYGASVVFLLMVVAAVSLQLWWLSLLPVVLLLAIWAFEKPLILFYMLLASIPWSTEYQFSDVLGTDLPDEPLMWLTALIALVLMVAQYKNIRQQTGAQSIVWILLLQLVWASLTIITSTFPLLSLKYVLAKSWYLASFVLLPLLVLDTKKKIKNASLILVASMSLQMVLAMVRHAAAGFSFAAVNASLTPFFRNHVNYSALLVCMVPLLVLFMKSAEGRFLKMLWGVLLVISLPALYFSYARGAWMAVVIGAVAYGLLKKKALVAAFLVTLILTASLVFWLQQQDRYLRYSNDFNTTIYHTNFTEHLLATYELKDLSTAERFYRWVAGVRMVKDSWKTGFGPSTFYNNYKSYTVPAFKTWVSANEEHSTVHNYFLLLLIEQGLVGLLLFLLLLFVLFYKCQRLYHETRDLFWKHTIVAVAVILAMVCAVNFLSDLIETDKVGSVFYLCIAVLMLAEKKISEEHSDFSPHIQRIA